jgi:hypothetical protein
MLNCRVRMRLFPVLNGIIPSEMKILDRRLNVAPMVDWTE